MSLLKQYVASFAVGLGTFVGGFSSAYTAPAMPSMLKDMDIKITHSDISWIGSLQPLFAFFGSFVGGWLLENIGRKKTIILGRGPFIIAFIMIYFSNDVRIMMLGRACAGLGVGIETLSSPIYLSETIDPEIRGRLGIFPTVMGNTGVLVAYIAGAYFEWRALALIGSLLPLPFFLFAWFLPESKTWLAAQEEKKRNEYYGKKSIYKEIRGFYSDWIEMFKRDTLKAVMICLGLQFFQQFSGINAIIYYAVDIFEKSGSKIDSNLSSVVVGVVNLVSTVIATGLVDKVGRKVLLYISMGLMFLTLLIMAIFFQLQSHDITCVGCEWIPLICLVTFVFGFSVGFGPLPWLMMGELLPKRIRGRAASFVTAFHWACTFVVTKTFIDIRYAYGDHSAFYVFSAICFFGIISTYWVPETKGKSLEVIEQKMSKQARTQAAQAAAAAAHTNSSAAQ